MTAAAAQAREIAAWIDSDAVDGDDARRLVAERLEREFLAAETRGRAACETSIRVILAAEARGRAARGRAAGRMQGIGEASEEILKQRSRGERGSAWDKAIMAAYENVRALAEKGPTK